MVVPAFRRPKVVLDGGCRCVGTCCCLAKPVAPASPPEPNRLRGRRAAEDRRRQCEASERPPVAGALVFLAPKSWGRCAPEEEEPKGSRPTLLHTIEAAVRGAVSACLGLLTNYRTPSGDALVHIFALDDCHAH